MLDEMVKTKKVDESIIKNLETLQSQFFELENFWIEKSKVPIQDAFVLYHTGRSSRMVLEKLGERFQEAMKKHLNPKVVGDAERVIPLINELYNSIIPFTEKKLTYETRFSILTRLKYMRDVAADADLLPSIEEEKKDVDTAKLKRQFGEFASQLQAMFFEE